MYLFRPKGDGFVGVNVERLAPPEKINNMTRPTVSSPIQLQIIMPSMNEKSASLPLFCDIVPVCDGIEGELSITPSLLLWSVGLLLCVEGCL